jgi:fructooligosaccharide transport system substrate-binding protein
VKTSKLFPLLSIFILAALILSACASPQPAAPDTGQPAVPDQPATEQPAAPPESVTLTMFQQQDALLVDAMRAILDDFEREYPHIKVVLDSAPFAEYHSKLSTSFAGGNPSDVFWSDIRTAAYASQGVLMPLDDFITQENWDDYLPSAWQETVWEGKTYAIPLHQLTEGLFINTAMAEAAGVRIPTSVDDAWTWEEFIDAAKAMTVQEGGTTVVWGFGQQRSLQDWSMLPIIYQNNGTTLSPDLKSASGYLNSPESVEAMAWMGSWFTTENIATVEQIPDAFPTGKYAIIQAPSSYRPFLESRFPELEFAIAPMMKNKSCAVTTGGWAMAIAANTRYPQEAWLLVDYVTRIAHEKWVVTSGYLPARTSLIASNPTFSEYPWSVFMEQLEKCSITRPATPHYNFYFDTFKQAVTDIAIGQDAKTVLDTAAQRLDAELSR